MKNKNKLCYGKNSEGALCVWDGKGTMHYVSYNANGDYNAEQLTQAKILTLLLGIADKLKIGVKL